MKLNLSSKINKLIKIVPEPATLSNLYYAPGGFRSGDEFQERLLREMPKFLPLEEEPTQFEPSDSILLPMLKAIGESYPSPRAQQNEVRRFCLSFLS